MSLAYLHVPKTGGISITWEMRKAGRKSPYHFYLKDKGETEGGFLTSMAGWYPGRSDLSRYDLLLGHGFLDTFIEAGADTFITVLREPRARLLSSYFYLRDSVPRKLLFLPPSIFDRELFLADGAMVELSLMEYIRAADMDANPIRNLCAPDGERDVQAVIDRLRTFDAIGFTENLGEFMQWLADRYGADLRVDRRLNVTRVKEEAVLGGSVDEIVSALTERTAPDAEIYRWAVRNRRHGFSAPPDPDVALKDALSRFKIV